MPKNALRWPETGIRVFCCRSAQSDHLMPRPPSPPPAQPRNALHGLTLEHIVTALAAHYGWAGLAERIPLRCFTSEPSVASSLKMLRKTPWARDKVEG